MTQSVWVPHTHWKSAVKCTSLLCLSVKCFSEEWCVFIMHFHSLFMHLQVPSIHQWLNGFAIHHTWIIPLTFKVWRILDRRFTVFIEESNAPAFKKWAMQITSVRVQVKLSRICVNILVISHILTSILNDKWKCDPLAAFSFDGNPMRRNSYRTACRDMQWVHHKLSARMECYCMRVDTEH